MEASSWAWRQAAGLRGFVCEPFEREPFEREPCERERSEHGPSERGPSEHVGRASVGRMCVDAHDSLSWLCCPAPRSPV